MAYDRYGLNIGLIARNLDASVLSLISLIPVFSVGIKRRKTPKENMRWGSWNRNLEQKLKGATSITAEMSSQSRIYSR